VEQNVGGIPGASGAKVHIVFDPPWSQDLMSEEAKLELGFL
jgi:metal-sulfur cluster biosynthetic enzyme